MVSTNHNRDTRMVSTRNPTSDPGEPLTYQIRIKGHLGHEWTDWFGGLAITLEENGDTLLTGPVADQAALHGLLRKVRDVGMPLLSVVCVTPGQAAFQREPSHSSHINMLWRKHMKAIVCPRYGSPDVLQLKEVEQPIPGDGQVLMKVYAASVNPLDWHMMRGSPFLVRMGGGMRAPKDPRLGADVAGRVEAIGANVTQFQPGDEVFGVCDGGFAEYATASEAKVALKPANLSFEESAAVPVAAFTALQGLRDAGHIQPGQTVLVNGASGGVGTFAVQLAKAFGGEVTGVCSTGNLDLVRSLGADHVIDYTQTDFTRNGQQYDLILDAVGNHSIAAYKRALKPQGRCVIVGFSGLPRLIQHMVLGPLISKTEGQKVGMMGIAKSNQQDLIVLKELLEAGKVAPVIDRRYPLDQAAEAIRYVEKGHARGKVVITVDQNDHLLS